MKFKVTVTETLSREFEIESEDKDSAYEKVESMIKSEDLVLDASDYVDRDIEIDDSTQA